MQRYGIDALSLVSKIEEVLGRNLNISHKEIAVSRVDKYFNENQQEAL